MIKEQYGVYEKTPRHGQNKDNLILAPFNSKEEAEQVGKNYGYYGHNYFVDKIKQKK